MTNDEIFEMLSEIESNLFYASSHEPDNDRLAEANMYVRKALVAFTKATGCHN